MFRGWGCKLPEPARRQAGRDSAPDRRIGGWHRNSAAPYRPSHLAPIANRRGGTIGGNWIAAQRASRSSLSKPAWPGAAAWPSGQSPSRCNVASDGWDICRRRPTEAAPCDPKQDGLTGDSDDNRSNSYSRDDISIHVCEPPLYLSYGHEVLTVTRI
jgi:hypothetical protein